MGPFQGEREQSRCADAILQYVPCSIIPVDPVVNAELSSDGRLVVIVALAAELSGKTRGKTMALLSISGSIRLSLRLSTRQSIHGHQPGSPKQ